MTFKKAQVLSSATLLLCAFSFYASPSLGQEEEEVQALVKPGAGQEKLAPSVGVVAPNSTVGDVRMQDKGYKPKGSLNQQQSNEPPPTPLPQRK